MNKEDKAILIIILVGVVALIVLKLGTINFPGAVEPYRTDIEMDRPGR